MRITRLRLCVLALLLAAGCRGGGRNELIERELRMQEDKIYQLEDMLDQCHAMLDSSRRENEALKQRDESGATDSVGGGPPSSAVPPSIMGPTRDDADVPGLEAPKIEPGVPVSPSGPDLDAPRAPGAPARGASYGDEPGDEKVVRIVLNKQLTGGRTLSGDQQDEALTVVFEPRGASGRWVKALGDVSIVVLDPAKRGAEARVARWDFTADEAAACFKKSLIGRGFHFELPWPSNPPTSGSLRLFVRFTTPEGEKFTADATIPVNPPDRQARGWTHAPARIATEPTVSTRAASDGGDEENAEPPAPAPGRRRSVLSKRGGNREATNPRRPAWSPYR